MFKCKSKDQYQTQTDSQHQSGSLWSSFHLCNFYSLLIAFCKTNLLRNREISKSAQALDHDLDYHEVLYSIFAGESVKMLCNWGSLFSLFLKRSQAKKTYFGCQENNAFSLSPSVDKFAMERTLKSSLLETWQTSFWPVRHNFKMSPAPLCTIPKKVKKIYWFKSTKNLARKQKKSGAEKLSISDKSLLQS